MAARRREWGRLGQLLQRHPWAIDKRNRTRVKTVVKALKSYQYKNVQIRHSEMHHLNPADN